MKNKKWIIATVAFLCLVALVVTVYLNTKPTGSKNESTSVSENENEKPGTSENKNEKTITVTIVHSDGQEKVLTITTEREFLADALVDEGLFAAEDIASGLTNVVDGETVDVTQQQWWKLLVNGKMMDYGMKQTPVNSDDQYRIEFTVGYEGMF